MFETLKELSDLAKFFIMLLIYTGYMTWWASGISHDFSNLKNSVDRYMMSDRVVTEQTVKLGQIVHHLELDMQNIQKSAKEQLAIHTKCGVIMENLINRVEKLEEK